MKNAIKKEVPFTVSEALANQLELIFQPFTAYVIKNNFARKFSVLKMTREEVITEGFVRIVEFLQKLPPDHKINATFVCAVGKWRLLSMRQHKAHVGLPQFEAHTAVLNAELSAEMDSLPGSAEPSGGGCYDEVCATLVKVAQIAPRFRRAVIDYFMERGTIEQVAARHNVPPRELSKQVRKFRNDIRTRYTRETFIERYM